MGLSVSQVVDKWKRGLSGATESYRAGVAAVSVAPGERAAAAADRALSGYQDSIQSGRFQSACRSVSLGEWQRAASEQGAARLAAGASKGAGKVQKFMTEFLPIMQSVSAEVQNMPKGSIEDSLNRVRKVMEAGKRYSGKKM